MKIRVKNKPGARSFFDSIANHEKLVHWVLTIFSSAVAVFTLVVYCLDFFSPSLVFIHKEPMAAIYFNTTGDPPYVSVVFYGFSMVNESLYRKFIVYGFELDLKYNDKVIARLHSQDFCDSDASFDKECAEKAFKLGKAGDGVLCEKIVFKKKTAFKPIILGPQSVFSDEMNFTPMGEFLIYRQFIKKFQHIGRLKREDNVQFVLHVFLENSEVVVDSNFLVRRKGLNSITTVPGCGIYAVKLKDMAVVTQKYQPDRDGISRINTHYKQIVGGIFELYNNIKWYFGFEDASEAR